MSKLIVEMEMPQNMCSDCEISIDGFACKKARTNGGKCPIVGVLPETHGDLIDRDAFIHRYLAFYTEQERKKNLVFAAVEVKQQFADMICDERPLIAAERNET